MEAQARSHLTTPQRRQILAKCEQPHTREQLRIELGFESSQALDNHLRPLREADLIHQHGESGGKPTFEWSKLFKSLSKTTKKSLLEGSK